MQKSWLAQLAVSQICVETQSFSAECVVPVQAAKFDSFKHRAEFKSDADDVHENKNPLIENGGWSDLNKILTWF